ncbi:MAG: tetratricopeptide repeat protein [Wenzhouxiangellaceae bacterium]|nr:MAG: tetratricopeptide repeat protein [Wenzhouxiangellaceae bacterium]
MSHESSVIDQAREQFQAGNFTTAEALFREALREKGDDPRLMMMIGLCLQRSGRAEDGLEQLQAAAALDPDDPGIQHQLASALVDLGRPEQARAPLKRCLTADPNHLLARTLLGHLELADQQTRAAADCFQAALRIDRDHPPALTGLAMAQLRLGQPEKARAHAERAAAQEPGNAAAQFALAQAYDALGHSGFAEQCLRNAAQIQPDSGRIWAALGTLLGRNGQYADAVQALNRALKLGAGTNRVWLGLASSLQQLGRLDEAQTMVERFLQRVPDNPVGQALLVELLLDRGKTEQARTVIQRLAAEQGPRITLLRARLAEATGELDQAHALASELHHADETALADAARLLSGRVAKARGTAVIARKALQPLIEAGRHEPASSSLLADTIAAGGQIDRARDVLERLVNDQARYTPSVRARGARHLARLLDRAGEHADASQFLELPGWHHCELLQRLATDSPAALQAAWDQETDFGEKTAAIEDGRSNPIFILGWPGSGRDLLLAALDKQAGGVQLSQERERNRREALGLPLEPEQLRQLDEGRLRLGRKRFLGELRGRSDSAGKPVIDTSWWEMTALPALARHFPGASVIVPRADTEALAFFWLLAGYRDLDRMQSEYAAERRRFLHFKPRLNLNFVDLGLKDLLDQPAETLATLGASLGLNFDEPALQGLASARRDTPYDNMHNWPHYRQKTVD